jgi:ABC-2 type transport system permease protein
MNLTGFYTLFYKELLRFYKVALQTLLAPVLTALLYLLVFSHVLEAHVQVFPGVSYTAFLVPGLIMMAVLQNAFANSSSSLIQSKITGNLFFVLVTPLSHAELFLALMGAAALRGLVVGVGMWLAALMFVSLPVHSVVVILVFALLAAMVLATLGVLAGLWADKFDELAGFQNFIIMPLTFLSGVFYSIHSLPGFWQAASHLNPFFYMIDGFRYGFFGVADVSPWLSMAVVAVTFIVLAVLTLGLLRRGYKIRS